MTILEAVPAPIPSDLAERDGAQVAGLRVDLITANVTKADYEKFIRVVETATFPNHQRVESFSLPPDSAHIEVNVRGLAQMPPTDVAALEADLAQLTECPIQLVEPGPA